MTRTKTHNISILGDGGWGTTLAILLAHKGYRVTLWSAFERYAALLDRKRLNPTFLPGMRIPQSIRITADLPEAAARARIVVLAIPSQYIRGVLKRIARCGFDRNAVFVSVTKGIETGSLKRVSEIVHEELGPVRLAVLSGPTIAREVAAGIPTTVVAASRNRQVQRLVQDVFMTERFRVYTSEDVAGVELGGSLKNVIAIACGIADGLGFGTNTKAAILSRGLAEISRLGHRLGAQVKTFSGISGLGDLVTTCASAHSRNRCLGEQIGRGRSLAKIVAGMQMVAEGVPTAKSAYRLSVRHRVDMPITREVYRVLYRNKPPQQAVRDLMTRQKKAE